MAGTANGKLKWKQVDKDSFIAGIEEEGISGGGGVDVDTVLQDNKFASNVSNIIANANFKVDNPITISETLTINHSNWNTETKRIKILTEVDIVNNNNIHPTISELETWNTNKVIPILEETDGITFQCETIPTVDLTFKIVSQNINESELFAKQKGFSFSISPEDWTGTEAPYIYEKEITDISKNGSFCFVDTDISSDVATGLLQYNQFKYITKIEVNNDIVKFLCYENKPTVEIPIIIKVV